MEHYNNLKNKILEEIENNKTAVTSKWIFISKNILKIFIITLLSIMIVFLTTLFMYFKIAPPIYVISLFLGFVAIEMIVRTYRFAYKSSVLYTFLGIAFLLTCTAFTFHELRFQASLHENMYMRPIHDNFDPRRFDKDFRKGQRDFLLK